MISEVGTKKTATCLWSKAHGSTHPCKSVCTYITHKLLRQAQVKAYYTNLKYIREDPCGVYAMMQWQALHCKMLPLSHVPLVIYIYTQLIRHVGHTAEVPYVCRYICNLTLLQRTRTKFA